jgi:FAD/FMN-containing dehydrogenase
MDEGLMAVKKWEKSRYTDPYLRDDLQDYGIITDTLECDIGSNGLEIFKALKRHFDPNNIMNPGGTLALNLPKTTLRIVRHRLI